MEHGNLFRHRCPRCHRIVEGKWPPDTGCPTCGWTSPLEGYGPNACVPGSELPVDVFDEGVRMRIVAWLPAVDGRDVSVGLEDGVLTIRADSPNGAYRREVELPCAVRGEGLSVLNNGVLEVTVEK